MCSVCGDADEAEGCARHASCPYSPDLGHAKRVHRSHATCLRCLFHCVSLVLPMPLAWGFKSSGLHSWRGVTRPHRGAQRSCLHMPHACVSSLRSAAATRSCCATGPAAVWPRTRRATAFPPSPPASGAATAALQVCTATADARARQQALFVALHTRACFLLSCQARPLRTLTLLGLPVQGWTPTPRTACCAPGRAARCGLSPVWALCGLPKVRGAILPPTTPPAALAVPRVQAAAEATQTRMFRLGRCCPACMSVPCAVQHIIWSQLQGFFS